MLPEKGFIAISLPMWIHIGSNSYNQWVVPLSKVDPKLLPSLEYAIDTDKNNKWMTEHDSIEYLNSLLPQRIIKKLWAHKANSYFLARETYCVKSPISEDEYLEFSVYNNSPYSPVYQWALQASTNFVIKTNIPARQLLVTEARSLNNICRKLRTNIRNGDPADKYYIYKCGRLVYTLTYDPTFYYSFKVEKHRFKPKVNDYAKLDNFQQYCKDLSPLPLP